MVFIIRKAVEECGNLRKREKSRFHWLVWVSNRNNVSFDNNVSHESVEQHKKLLLDIDFVEIWSIHTALTQFFQ